MEAVNVLQDNGLWKYAATLAAHALKRDEQAAALERWAVHIHQVCSSLNDDRVLTPILLLTATV